MKKKQATPIPFLRIIFALTVAAIPFIFTLSSAEPALTPRYLAVALMLFLILIFTTVQRLRNKINLDYSLLRRIIFPLFLLYIITGILSLSQAINLAEGINEVAKMFLFFIFLVTASLVIAGDPRFIPLLSRALSLSAALLSIIALCQYTGIAFTGISSNTFLDATMFNKNLLSGALLLMLPFIAYGILNFKGLWNDACIISTALSAFIIGIAHTRAAWAGLAGMALFLLFSRFMLKKQTSSSQRQGLNLNRFAISAIIFIAVFFISLGIESFYKTEILRQRKSQGHKFTETYKLASRNYGSAQTVNIRLTLWKKTLQIIADHPLLGVGPGNWKIMVPKYGTEGLQSASGKLNFIRPHNDYLWVFAESGIFGFLFYLSLFGAAFYYLYRIVFRSDDAQAKWLAILMGSGIIAYLIFSAFDFPRERIVHSTLLLLMFAAVSVAHHKAFPMPPRLLSKFILPINFLMMIILAACIAIGFSRLISEIHTQKAEHPALVQNRLMQIEELDRAETFFYNIDPVANPLALHRGEANLALNRMDEAFEDFVQATRVHPYNILALWNVAAMYDRKGELKKSEEYFKKVLEISPRLEEALLNLTAVYIKMGRYVEALEVINRCNPESRNPQVAQYRRLIEGKLAGN